MPPNGVGARRQDGDHRFDPSAPDLVIAFRNPFCGGHGVFPTAGLTPFHQALPAPPALVKRAPSSTFNALAIRSIESIVGFEATPDSRRLTTDWFRPALAASAFLEMPCRSRSSAKRRNTFWIIALRLSASVTPIFLSNAVLDHGYA